MMARGAEQDELAVDGGDEAGEAVYGAVSGDAVWASGHAPWAL